MSSKAEEDIIELGEDGSFDITSVSVKQQKVEEVDYNDYDWTQADRLEKLSLVEALKPNEFAIYQNDKSNTLWVITKLSEGEELAEVVFARHEELVLTSKSGQKLKIKTPTNLKLDSKTIECKVCGGLVTCLLRVV